MRLLFLSVFSIVILIACTQTVPKDELVDNKTLPDPFTGYYTLYAVVENDDYRDNHELDAINESLSEESRKYLYDRGIVWTWDRRVENIIYDYTGKFDIESYPTFLVFDTDELILQTTDINEVEEFVSTNKPDRRE
ncbi:hypothetical protein [Texcoconibacillus texcoconensis]|uniref:Uncharacterized protein n=1 Tax=Texcoconibacillus texcoconensis TaxID=1095777 RepID=A0A840QPQ6_9BACI|nr:hypothetical protein [Texcoconibacillus texcoconensis]MBB5173355.1 hypothetical protein [Texcoconibacillus texcoconensis]